MDEAAKKTALRMITYGLYLVGCRMGERVNAFTADWLTQTSFKPPLVALGVKVDSLSHTMIDTDRVFSVNILERGQKELAAKFFRHVEPEGNTFAGVPFRTGVTGCPIFPDALAYFECEVVADVKKGDHTLFVGQVVEAGVHREGEPLTLRETGWYYGG